MHGLSLGYRLATTLRNMAYDHGLLKIHAVDVPVISIGNLTTGGTGKTPVVATVVHLLRELGHRPGIVSRGYRSDDSGENDEKRVLKLLCPGVPHEQNPDRVAACRTLIQHHDVTAIVLDDAFQHRRIHRNVNLALIDATNPFGYGYHLPRGLLRESIGGLGRADLVLITRTDQVPASVVRDICDIIRMHCPRQEQKIFRICFRPTSLLDSTGQLHDLTTIHNQPVFVMTAIGNPSAFHDTCENLGARIVGTAFFPDHHHFTAADLQSIHQQAQSAGTHTILITTKDLVKLPPQSLGFLAVQVETVFEATADRSILQEKIAARLP
ncbi:MAG: tetraacyldisaccharide 4'-kinase [Planctomycetaceae bacterium]